MCHLQEIYFSCFHITRSPRTSTGSFRGIFSFLTRDNPFLFFINGNLTAATTEKKQRLPSRTTHTSRSLRKLSHSNSQEKVKYKIEYQMNVCFIIGLATRAGWCLLKTRWRKTTHRNLQTYKKVAAFYVEEKKGRANNEIYLIKINFEKGEERLRLATFRINFHLLLTQWITLHHSAIIPE